MADEVKLLGAWMSPFSRRVELALKLKGVPYDYIEQDLANKSTLLVESNPVYKKVPVLIHKGKPIAESLIILEYIEDTWSGHPLLPKDPAERAQARFWAKFVDDKCLPCVWMSCWTEGEIQKNLMEEAKENLSILEGALEGKTFFGGDAIGLVDIAANFLSLWVGVLEQVAGISFISEDKHPALWKWSQDFVSSDVVKECLPEREKFLTLMQSKKEAILVTKAPAY